MHHSAISTLPKNKLKIVIINKATLYIKHICNSLSETMPPKSKITLTDAQKYELCVYARDHKLRSRSEYVDWIEQKWGVRVNESTITRILQTKDQRLSTEVNNPETRQHRSVTAPELELALKEFVLVYQTRTILSDALLIEKAKALANELNIPEGTLQFSSGWLQKFKERNGIHHEKLHGEEASVDQAAVIDALPILHDKCANYSPNRIYNMDETSLFYRCVINSTLN